MTTLLHIISATAIISIISLIGILGISLKKKWLQKYLFIFVSFATGTLLGVAFLDLIPEAFESEINLHLLSFFPLIGILSFFVLEKLLYWHHHHQDHQQQQTHSFTYLNLIGDGFHNFIDGVVIAAGFLVSVPLGITTTIAILFHEIPQEISDFFILIHGGFSQKKALIFNFVSALVAMLGGILGFFFLATTEALIPYVLAYTAGMFIYIATVDIIPTLLDESEKKVSVIQFLSIVAGIIVISAVITLLTTH